MRALDDARMRRNATAENPSSPASDLRTAAAAAAAAAAATAAAVVLRQPVRRHLAPVVIRRTRSCSAIQYRTAGDSANSQFSPLFFRGRRAKGRATSIVGRSSAGHKKMRRYAGLAGPDLRSLNLTSGRRVWPGLACPVLSCPVLSCPVLFKSQTRYGGV